MERTPITKLSEAAESGIITNSPALWEEWKKIEENVFRTEIILAYTNSNHNTIDQAIDYYEQRFGKLKQHPHHT